MIYSLQHELLGGAWGSLSSKLLRIAPGPGPWVPRDQGTEGEKGNLSPVRINFLFSRAVTCTNVTEALTGEVAAGVATQMRKKKGLLLCQLGRRKPGRSHHFCVKCEFQCSWSRDCQHLVSPTSSDSQMFHSTSDFIADKHYMDKNQGQML
jgi:hypothetical protein